MKRIAIGCLVVVLAACAPNVPERTSPAAPAPAGAAPSAAPTLPGAAPTLPDAAPAVPAAPSVATPSAASPPGSPAPGSSAPLPGTLYVCVTGSGGERRQAAIQFAPNVQALCQRHPEMGPCQYERAACRKAGGRVFDVAGREITLATEAEYDRKVMRFRFRAN